MPANKKIDNAQIENARLAEQLLNSHAAEISEDRYATPQEQYELWLHEVEPRSSMRKYTLLEWLVYFDKHDLFTKIDRATLNLDKYLKWEYKHTNDPCFDLFWLNLICAWAINYDERAWLESMLKQEPSVTSASIIKLYLDCSAPGTIAQYKKIDRGLQIQEWVNRWMNATLARYNWPTPNYQFESDVERFEKYQLLLKREGDELADLSKRIRYHNTELFPGHENFRRILSPACFFALIVLMKGIIELYNDTDPKFDVTKRGVNILLAVMCVLALDAVYLTLNIVAALALRIYHGDKLQIFHSAEVNVLSSYQNYLLRNLLVPQPSLAGSESEIDIEAGILHRVAPCFKGMYAMKKASQPLTAVQTGTQADRRVTPVISI